MINRGYCYVLYLNDGKTPDVEYKLLQKYRKYIACISNYIVLDAGINSSLMNRPVFEKIELLEQYVAERGIDFVIPSLTSQKHYYLIKKIMHDESKYPKKKLDVATRKKEKKQLLRTYYTNYFYDEYMQVANSLCKPEICFEAEAGYKLEKAGFFLKGRQYTINSDSDFSNVIAEIDGKNKRIIMSIKLINQDYGEENRAKEFDSLMDRARSLLTEQFEKQPSVHSEFENKSVTFEYPIELSQPKIEEFLEGLSTIKLS